MIHSRLPMEPGVYLFRDNDGRVIYIGKAKHLKKRVSSYFRKSTDAKINFLVSQIADIDYIAVDNEVEALLLENRLIKKHRPHYNISLKDSGTYSYIKITNEKFPRILSARISAGKGHYFGPYVDGGARAELLQLVVKLFKLRTCKTLPKRACLNFHIGTCTAPCIKEVNTEEYEKQVRAAVTFLNGNMQPVIDKLEKEMKEASNNYNFEVALEKKRQIETIHKINNKQKVDLVKSFDQDVLALYAKDGVAIIELLSIVKGVILGKKEFRFENEPEIFENFIKMYYSENYIPNEIIVNTAFWNNKEEKTVIESYLEKIKGGRIAIICPSKGEKLELVKLAEKNARLHFENKILAEIQERLGLPTMPLVIECFDVSNLGYDYVVAAMTRWVNGVPNKSGYRKFEIKRFSGKNDDFASIREVVHRRYKRLLEEKKEMPNLIIIDGGLGQLNAALDSLKSLSLKIPVIALAKENEEIFIPDQNVPFRFDKNSSFMLLLRSIRDSVHKFALSYNRKKRQMRFREVVENYSNAPK